MRWCSSGFVRGECFPRHSVCNRLRLSGLLCCDGLDVECERHKSHPADVEQERSGVLGERCDEYEKLSVSPSPPVFKVCVIRLLY